MADDASSEVQCSKLPPKHSIYSVLDRKVTGVLPSFQCDDRVLEKLVSNYIIVKEIISNLEWQDMMLCKLVNRMWRDAVNALQRETLGAQDFVLVGESEYVKYVAADKIQTEPLATFVFASTAAVGTTSACQHYRPAVCEPPCKDAHDVLDVIDHKINSPKECIMAIKTDYIIYMPISESVTSSYIVKKSNLSSLSVLVGGLVIPKIPGVEYHVLNIKLHNNTKQEFFNPVNKIMKTSYIKGMLVFLTDKYLLHSLEDVAFLYEFDSIKQKIPYALGGCIIEDTLTSLSDISSLVTSSKEDTDYVSENLISIALFTVPKEQHDQTRSKHNFEMYSVILKSSDWSEVKIKKVIEEFAWSVPRTEHSAALKLSCVGRDVWHDVEQDAFREAFPRTPLAGCYGNGEVGVDHPVRAPVPAASPTPAACQRPTKRPRVSPAPAPAPPPRPQPAEPPQHSPNSMMYSYSTVFVYFGWGKLLPK